MMGIDSCGMLLSAIHNVNGEEKLNLVMLDDAIPAVQNCIKNINVTWLLITV